MVEESQMCKTIRGYIVGVLPNQRLVEFKCTFHDTILFSLSKDINTEELKDNLYKVIEVTIKDDELISWQKV